MEKIAKDNIGQTCLIYGGEENFIFDDVHVFNWHDYPQHLQSILK